MTHVSVSVIIPTFNYGTFIKECIDSVFAQTFQNYEIIVIDDGSTDNTPEILSEISDPRLIAVRTPNQGVSSARNTGLDMAQGDFIAFLDADDRWLPHKLETQVAVFAAEPTVGFVFSNFRRFNSKDGSLMLDQFKYAPELKKLQTSLVSGTKAYKIQGNALTMLLTLSDMPWYPPANMIRSSLTSNERFTKQRKIGEDVDYFLRIWRKTEAAFIPEISAEIRRHESNTTKTLEFSSSLIMLDILAAFTSHSLTDEQLLAIRNKKGRAWSSLGYGKWTNELYLQAATAYIHSLQYPGSRVTAIKHLTATPAVLVVSFLKFLTTALVTNSKKIN